MKTLGEQTKLVMSQMVEDLETKDTTICFVTGNDAIASLMKKVAVWNNEYLKGNRETYPFFIHIKPSICVRTIGDRDCTGIEFTFLRMNQEY